MFSSIVCKYEIFKYEIRYRSLTIGQRFPLNPNFLNTKFEKGKIPYSLGLDFVSSFAISFFKIAANIFSNSILPG